MVFQPFKVALVPHPAIFKNVKTLDLENGVIAAITNIGIKLAAFVKTDEVQIRFFPGTLIIVDPDFQTIN